MIRTRRASFGAVAAIAVLAAVGAGGPGPAARLAADRLVVEQARLADAALADLEAGIGVALEAARRGAARIVSGDEPPGPQWRAAADHLAASEPRAAGARAARRALDAARRARDPGVADSGEAVPPGELASIGAQLDETAVAGNAFAEMRWRAAEVTDALQRALAALDAGDLSRAEGAVEEAREAFADIEAWEVDLVTLPVWLQTADAMIGAMETIVAATAAGDAQGAARSADAFADLAEAGATADRALRIAISEGGSAVAAPALDRLAAALTAIREARAETAESLGAGDR